LGVWRRSGGLRLDCFERMYEIVRMSRLCRGEYLLGARRRACRLMYTYD
jgi:hypothetical protein